MSHTLTPFLTQTIHRYITDRLAAMTEKEVEEAETLAAVVAASDENSPASQDFASSLSSTGSSSKKKKKTKKKSPSKSTEKATAALRQRSSSIDNLPSPPANAVVAKVHEKASPPLAHVPAPAAPSGVDSDLMARLARLKSLAK